MSLVIETGKFEDAKSVRELVFVEEQGFKLEFDSLDDNPHMIHITAYDDGALVGCARIFPSILEEGLETEETTWVFGRLAVLAQYRGRGYGAQILHASENMVQDLGAKTLCLHAQCRAQPFYRKLGYEAFGPIEFDEHVEHQWMRKELNCVL